ncbi:aquaporin-11 [Bombina bombina]|uniref:aquaporin-11 n=1 Tax=Bombina bombina TaxID=8345 RepID=UPI00235B2401|nr:aquaporin-11 [Bombina bombina]
MEVLWGSALFVAAVVLVCEAARSVLRGELLTEVVSTLQLCCCVSELALLGAEGGLSPSLGLGLTYLFTIIHSSTARAACNPCGSLQPWLRNQAPARNTAMRVGAQFVGSALSYVVMPAVWGAGLIPLHRTWSGVCRSPLHTSLLSGAAVEMLCTLGLFALLHRLDQVKAPYRVHAVALLITAMVLAGGHLTGAVFNPALAFSLVFNCVGNTFFEYAFVYWLGPLVGLVVSLLLFDGSIPKLKGSVPTEYRLKRD